MSPQLDFQIFFATYGVLELTWALVFAVRFGWTPCGVLGTTSCVFLGAAKLVGSFSSIDMEMLMVPRLIATGLVVVAIYIAPIRSNHKVPNKA